MNAQRAANRRQRADGRWALVLATGFLFTAGALGDVQYRADFDGLSSVWTGATGFEHAIRQVPPAPAAPALHGDFSMARPTDRISLALAARACDAAVIPRVRFEMRNSTPEGVQYYAVRMSDVLVSSYSVSNSGGGDRPMEQLSLNYAKIEWTYIRTDTADRGEGTASSHWDLDTGAGDVVDPDSDGDGIPDSYEVDERLKPLVDDVDEDADGDGLTNEEEWRAGTSAGNADSVFRVVVVAVPGGGSVAVRVTFSSVPGRIYDLFTAGEVDELADVVDPITTVTADSDLTTVNLDLPASRAFVRARVRVP